MNSNIKTLPVELLTTSNPPGGGIPSSADDFQRETTSTTSIPQIIFFNHTSEYQNSETKFLTGIHNFMNITHLSSSTTEHPQHQPSNNVPLLHHDDLTLIVKPLKKLTGDQNPHTEIPHSVYKFRINSLSSLKNASELEQIPANHSFQKDQDITKDEIQTSTQLPDGDLTTFVVISGYDVQDVTSKPQYPGSNHPSNFYKSSISDINSYTESYSYFTESDMNTKKMVSTYTPAHEKIHDKIKLEENKKIIPELQIQKSSNDKISDGGKPAGTDMYLIYNFGSETQTDGLEISKQQQFASDHRGTEGTLYPQSKIYENHIHKSSLNPHYLNSTENNLEQTTSNEGSKIIKQNLVTNFYHQLSSSTPRIKENNMAYLTANPQYQVIESVPSHQNNEHIYIPKPQPASSAMLKPQDIVSHPVKRPELGTFNLGQNYPENVVVNTGNFRPSTYNDTKRNGEQETQTFETHDDLSGKTVLHKYEGPISTTESHHSIYESVPITQADKATYSLTSQHLSSSILRPQGNTHGTSESTNKFPYIFEDTKYNGVIIPETIQMQKYENEDGTSAGYQLELPQLNSNDASHTKLEFQGYATFSPAESIDTKSNLLSFQNPLSHSTLKSTNHTDSSLPSTHYQTTGSISEILLNRKDSFQYPNYNSPSSTSRPKYDVPGITARTQFTTSSVTLKPQLSLPSLPQSPPYYISTEPVQEQHYFPTPYANLQQRQNISNISHEQYSSMITKRPNSKNNSKPQHIIVKVWNLVNGQLQLTGSQKVPVEDLKLVNISPRNESTKDDDTTFQNTGTGIHNHNIPNFEISTSDEDAIRMKPVTQTNPYDFPIHKVHDFNPSSQLYETEETYEPIIGKPAGISSSFLPGNQENEPLSSQSYNAEFQKFLQLHLLKQTHSNEGQSNSSINSDVTTHNSTSLLISPNIVTSSQSSLIPSYPSHWASSPPTTTLSYLLANTDLPMRKPYAPFNNNKSETFGSYPYLQSPVNTLRPYQYPLNTIIPNQYPSHLHDPSYSEKLVTYLHKNTKDTSHISTDVKDIYPQADPDKTSISDQSLAYLGNQEYPFTSSSVASMVPLPPLFAENDMSYINSQNFPSQGTNINDKRNQSLSSRQPENHLSPPSQIINSLPPRA